MFDELNRMFSQAGLRFDQDFLNRTFSRQGGVVFQFFTGPGGRGGAYGGEAAVASYKPNWLERLFSKITMKLMGFALRRLFSVQTKPPPKPALDRHIDISISAAEAVVGGEKSVSYKTGSKTKKLMVKIPSGVKTGTRIRLKGAGAVVGRKRGDLYLRVNIKE